VLSGKHKNVTIRADSNLLRNCVNTAACEFDLFVQSGKPAAAAEPPPKRPRQCTSAKFSSSVTTMESVPPHALNAILEAIDPMTFNITVLESMDLADTLEAKLQPS
jgi:hypothetical protein